MTSLPARAASADLIVTPRGLPPLRPPPQPATPGPRSPTTDGAASTLPRAQQPFGPLTSSRPEFITTPLVQKSPLTSAPSQALFPRVHAAKLTSGPAVPGSSLGGLLIPSRCCLRAMADERAAAAAARVELEVERDTARLAAAEAEAQVAAFRSEVRAARAAQARATTRTDVIEKALTTCELVAGEVGQRRAASDALLSALQKKMESNERLALAAWSASSATCGVVGGAPDAVAPPCADDAPPQPTHVGISPQLSQLSDLEQAIENMFIRAVAQAGDAATTAVDTDASGAAGVAPKPHTLGPATRAAVAPAREFLLRAVAAVRAARSEAASARGERDELQAQLHTLQGRIEALTRAFDSTATELGETQTSLYQTEDLLAAAVRRGEAVEAALQRSLMDAVSFSTGPVRQVEARGTQTAPANSASHTDTDAAADATLAATSLDTEDLAELVMLRRANLTQTRRATDAETAVRIYRLNAQSATDKLHEVQAAHTKLQGEYARLQQQCDAVQTQLAERVRQEQLQLDLAARRAAARARTRQVQQQQQAQPGQQRQHAFPGAAAQPTSARSDSHSAPQPQRCEGDHYPPQQRLSAEPAVAAHNVTIQQRHQGGLPAAAWDHPGPPHPHTDAIHPRTSITSGVPAAAAAPASSHGWSLAAALEEALIVDGAGPSPAPATLHRRTVFSGARRERD